jgi:uncharacterized protein YbjT (DUF2867 family)
VNIKMGVVSGPSTLSGADFPVRHRGLSFIQQFQETVTMTLKYLITGATGCIGSRVLAYFVGNVPSSDYAATSSREASRQHFEKDGIAFRLANYDEPETLDIAFKDVENLFFVSTDTFDTSRRIVQHRNAIEVARRAGVKHVS